MARLLGTRATRLASSGSGSGSGEGWRPDLEELEACRSLESEPQRTSTRLVFPERQADKTMHIVIIVIIITTMADSTLTYLQPLPLPLG